MQALGWLLAIGIGVYALKNIRLELLFQLALFAALIGLVFLLG